MREKWEKKVWEKCEKQTHGKNVKNSGGNFLEKKVKKIDVENCCKPPGPNMMGQSETSSNS